MASTVTEGGRFSLESFNNLRTDKNHVRDAWSYHFRALAPGGDSGCCVAASAARATMSRAVDGRSFGTAGIPSVSTMIVSILSYCYVPSASSLPVNNLNIDVIAHRVAPAGADLELESSGDSKDDIWVCITVDLLLSIGASESAPRSLF